MKIKLLIYILLISTSSIAQQWYQVRVQLTSDQPFYFSGQQMRMSYQIIDPLNSKVVPSNEIVYVVLKNRSYGNVFEQKVFAKNGLGELNAMISEKVTTGYYELIAYTNYMRNLGPDSYFRKKISIYNTKDNFRSAAEKENTFIDFYPEGGQLIEGITSRVVYHHGGYCTNRQVSLIDDKEKTLQSFETHESGIGSLFFQPEKNRNYRIDHACDSGDLVNYNLPKTLSEGYSLSITQRNKKTQVTVRAKGKSLSNANVKIMAFANDSKVLESNVTLDKGVLFTEIVNQDLPSDAVSFFVFNNQNQMVANRSAFINKGQTDSPLINLTDLQYSTKQEISFELSGVSKSSSTSVQVIPNNWLNDYVQKGRDNLIAGAQLNYDNIRFQNNRKLLDDLLIINASKNKAIPESFSDTQTYTKEEVLYIRGKLSDSKPLPDTTRLSFFVPEVNWVYQIKVGSSGHFEFPILGEFSNKQDIIFHTISEDHEYENPRITTNDFSTEPRFTLSGKLPWTPMHVEMKSTYLNQQKIADVFEFYESIEANKESKTDFNVRKLFPKPDAVFLLDDYSSFSNMEETIKEVINGLWTRKRKGKTVLRMFASNWIREYDIELTDEYNPTPFIVINNKPSSVEGLLSLDPADVEKISLIKKHSKLGYLIPFGSGGVIIVDLKKGAEENLGSQLTKFRSTGISTITKNQVENRPNNVPDMRDILLWAPNQTTEEDEPAKVRFNTSDRPGDYAIIVETINENGEIGYATKKINVAFKGTSQASKISRE